MSPTATLPPDRADPRAVGPGLPARRPARRAAGARGRARGRDRPGQAGRLGFDILRPSRSRPTASRTRTLRPGRNVEQIEATLTDAGSGDALMRLSAWRLRREELELPAGIGEPDPPPPPPESGTSSLPAFWTEPVAYHAALDWRFVARRVRRARPGDAWTRLRVPLVAGEPASPLERLLVMADAASGISHVLDWSSGCSSTSSSASTWSGRRRASGWPWTRPRGSARPGAGLCTSVLSDERGRVGVSTQTLRVAQTEVVFASQ